MILVSTTFWSRSTLFFKHMCMRFQPQPWLDLFSAWCVLFSEAANYFCQQFGRFWNLCKQCVWREFGNGDEFLFEEMVNSSPMNSPTWWWCRSEAVLVFHTLDAVEADPIRRGTHAHATSGCNWVLLDFRMVAERLCSTRSVIRRVDARK